MVVSGHRRPDGGDRAVETMIAETRPDVSQPWGLWSLMLSAGSAIGARDSGVSVIDAVAEKIAPPSA